MFVVDQDKRTAINMDDISMLSASSDEYHNTFVRVRLFSEPDDSFVIGSYYSLEDCQRVIYDILRTYNDGKSVYEMPQKGGN